MSRPRPSPRTITEAEEAMLWLRRLEPELGKLVWASVSGTEWKPICWQIRHFAPVGIRAQRHCLAAERLASAQKAVAEVCCRGRGDDWADQSPLGTDADAKIRRQSELADLGAQRSCPGSGGDDNSRGDSHPVLCREGSGAFCDRLLNLPPVLLRLCR